jgi:hypothetical protein
VSGGVVEDLIGNLVEDLVKSDARSCAFDVLCPDRKVE